MDSERIKLGARPPYFFTINGLLVESDTEYVSVDDIVRLHGHDPETHEVHPDGWTRGHPLTKAIRVTHYSNLLVVPIGQRDRGTDRVPVATGQLWSE